MAKRGQILVVSAPSGTGKSTVCRLLLETHADLALSISYTTRAPRGSERDGVEYHFVDDATFDRMVADGAFLEWAPVHGKRYGSGKDATERLISQGVDLLFDIDVQGGQQIKRAHPEALLVFLLPPSIEQLLERLQGRKTETPDQVSRRLGAAAEELRRGLHYDYHVINDAVERAVAQIDRIRKKQTKSPLRDEKLVQKLVDDAEKRFTVTV
jgi:guanylate kinase